MVPPVNSTKQIKGKRDINSQKSLPENRSKENTS